MRLDQITVDEMMLLKAEPSQSSAVSPGDVGQDVGSDMKLMAHLCTDYLDGLRQVNSRCGRDSNIASLIDQLHNAFQHKLGLSLSELMTKDASKDSAVADLEAKLEDIAKNTPGELDRQSVHDAVGDICKKHGCNLSQLRTLFIQRHKLGPTDWAIKLHRSVHEEIGRAHV